MALGKPDNKKRFFNRVGSFLKREKDWLEITGYHAEAIHSEQPVRLMVGATVASDVYAPKVATAGLIRGFVVSLELLVEAEGQIWGDVYTSLLMVEPGGKVQGWLSTIDEDDYDLLAQGEITPTTLTNALNAPTLPTRPKLSADDLLPNDDQGQLAILRRIRMEAAEALVARAELEEAFEEKLAERAGEKIAEAEKLRQELLVVRGDLLAIERQQGSMSEKLQLRDQTVSSQTEQVTQLQVELEEKTAALNNLLQMHEEQGQLKTAIESEFNELNEALRSERERVEVLSARMENMEPALQASLQRAADQQEALVRWQELAELGENQVGGLNEELVNAQGKLEDTEGMLGMLRKQRDKLQDEHDTLKIELEGLRRQVGSDMPDTESAKVALEVTNQRIAELETAVAEQQKTLDRERVQLLEHQQVREQAEAELKRIQRKNEHQIKLINELKGSNKEHQEQAEKWKNTVGRMTDILYGAEERMKEMRTRLDTAEQEVTANRESLQVDLHEYELKLKEKMAKTREQWEQAQQDAEAEKKVLKEELHNRKLQLEAMEEEVTYYIQEIDGQRQRLTEMQATLIEREIELDKIKVTLQEQTIEARKIRQLATTRIRQLEGDLVQAKHRLKSMDKRL